ncbi:MAG TPA: transporter, partial [Chlorobaculum parvum]|nr:transporter [Chlorobaculum parvum]
RLGLMEGMAVSAIVKASTIILGTDLDGAKVSARNRLCGTVTSVTDGAVSTEVSLEIGGSDVLSAVITRQSAKSLGLTKGSYACAIFKAPSVIIGVE